MSHTVIEYEPEVKAMRLVYVLGLGLLVSVRISGQPNSIIAGEYVEARSGEVYTCGCLYSSEQVTAGREAILACDIRGTSTGESSWPV